MERREQPKPKRYLVSGHALPQLRLLRKCPGPAASKLMRQGEAYAELARSLVVKPSGAQLAVRAGRAEMSSLGAIAAPAYQDRFAQALQAGGLILHGHHSR